MCMNDLRVPVGDILKLQCGWQRAKARCGLSLKSPFSSEYIPSRSNSSADQLNKQAHHFGPVLFHGWKR